MARPSFSWGILKKNNGYGKIIDTGAIVYIGFDKGQKKLTDGSGKMIYLGTVGQGFIVYY
jgi:hypothetical protein